MGPDDQVFVLVGDGQVEFYRSAEALRRHVEAIDASLFRVFDSEGTEYHLSGASEEGSFLGLRVVTSHATELGPPGERHVGDLLAALLEWWRRSGGGPEASGVTLPALLAALVRRDGIR